MENLFTFNLSYVDKTGKKQSLDLLIDENDITTMSHAPAENDNTSDTVSGKGRLSNAFVPDAPEGLCGKWSIPVELVYELNQNHSGSTWPAGMNIDLFSLNQDGSHDRTIFHGSGHYENRVAGMEGLYYDYTGAYPAEITIADQYVLQNIAIV